MELGLRILNTLIEMNAYYKCHLCTKTFIQKSSLDDHAARDHINKKLYLTCDICNKAYDHSNFKSHSCTNNMQPNVFSCPICKKIYDRPNSVKEHIKNVHENRNKIVARVHDVFNCPKCDLNTKNEEEFKEHMRMKHPL